MLSYMVLAVTNIHQDLCFHARQSLADRNGQRWPVGRRQVEMQEVAVPELHIQPLHTQPLDTGGVATNT